MKNYKKIWLKELRRHLRKWQLRINFAFGGKNND